MWKIGWSAGHVDERGEEGDLGRDSPEQHAVREEADRAQRRAVGARGERRADLAGDDAREGHRRRLEVGVVEREPAETSAPLLQPACQRT